MVRTKVRKSVASLSIGLAVLLALPGCEPGDTVPILRSIVVQPDQTTLRVSWPAALQPVGSYEIWYRPTGTTTWIWSSTGDVGADHRSWVPVIPGATEYTRDFKALGITAGNTYDVSVRSTPVGEGTPTSQDQAASKATVTARAPAPSATVTANSINMSWPASSFSPWKEWNFYLSPGTTATPALHSTSTTMGLTTKSFTGLSPNTTYTVGLRAVQTTGDGTNGQVSSALRTVQVTTASDWTLTFNDEFAGSAVDTTKWKVLNEGVGNYYSCMKTQNAVVGGGTLKLIARSEAATCNGGLPLPYTGAYIQTRDAPNSFSQAYGKWEFRVRMPQGKGLWPGIWLSNVGGASQGELDIIEEIGIDPHAWASTIHYYPSGTPRLQSNRGGPTNPDVDLSGGFHTYSLEWTPCRIQISLDGNVQALWTDWFGMTPDPFDANGPMHIRLDNKAGRRLPDNTVTWAMREDNLADPSTPFTEDKVMEIDWVRVYSKPLTSYPLPAGCPNR